MIVYLDSSFVIRQLLGVGEIWSGWGKWEKAYASTLLRTECFRAANLLRLENKLDDAQRARLGTWIEQVCDSVTQVSLTDTVLRRAAETFPISVGTLQAIHLATLLELKAAHDVTCELATDDPTLLKAAQSLGFADALAAKEAKPAAPAKPADEKKAEK